MFMSTPFRIAPRTARARARDKRTHAFALVPREGFGTLERALGYYWVYYLATMLAAFAVQNPWVVLGIGAFFALRRFLPDPIAIARNLGRIGRLRAQAELNAANVVVRRDLGRAYLELRVPKRALVYLDQALAIDPRTAT